MVLQRLAANALDPRRAGLLLYGLQIASINLPKAAQTKPNEENSQDDTVEDVTLDPSLGALAPEAAYTPPSRTRDLEEILLDGWKADDEAYARDQEDLRSSQDKDNILANVNAATGRGFNIGAGQIGEPERVLIFTTGPIVAKVGVARSEPAPRQQAQLNHQVALVRKSPLPHRRRFHPQTEKPTLSGGPILIYAGDHLISHTLTRAVPSAQRGLTSVFGMGTGVTLAVNSPANCRTCSLLAIVRN